MRVVIGVPVWNRRWILPQFCECLEKMDTRDLEVLYLFLENGSDDSTYEYLEERYTDNPLAPNVTILKATGPILEMPPYDKSRDYHSYGKMERMKTLRDKIRVFACNANADYLWMLDSDVLVQPTTLKVMIAHKKPVVAPLMTFEGTGEFTAPNGFIYHPNTGGPYSSPSWQEWVTVSENPHLRKVDFVVAAPLISREVFTQMTYMDEGSRSEDLAFGLACYQRFDSYLDETHRVFHCGNPALLDLYLEEKERSKGSKHAVKILTQRLFLGLDPAKAVKPGG